MCQGAAQRTVPAGRAPTRQNARPRCGAQDAVSTGGPALALLGFIVLPLVWSVPEALVTAELATAFPEDSGYVAWVTAAFGPFWGFQEGWWSWLSGVTDNSVYPVLMLSYVDAVLPGARAPRARRPGPLRPCARVSARRRCPGRPALQTAGP
jgi:amino acid transporter